LGYSLNAVIGIVIEILDAALRLFKVRLKTEKLDANLSIETLVQAYRDAELLEQVFLQRII